MAATSSRVSSSWAKSAGRPTFSAAARRASHRARLVLMASRPPLSSTALPLLRAREAICTRASGRLSKITPMTPMGQVMRYILRPSVSSRLRVVWPMGSGRPARARRPAVTAASFSSANFRRPSRGAARLSCSALARSALLAAKISAWRASSSSAMASRAAFRVSISDAASVHAARRASWAIWCRSFIGKTSLNLTIISEKKEIAKPEKLCYTKNPNKVQS